jgi:ATP-dependent helicase/nuclease subunit B
MLKIVTGRFHPELEAALVEEVRSLKDTDPLAPVAIVVPSELLRRRIQHVLCVEGRLALIQVHLLTFHHLALQVAHEQAAMAGADGLRVTIVSDLFFSHLLRCLARRRLSGWEELGLADLTLGGWAALWATVKDLKDALVDPAVALEAVADGVFGEDSASQLEALLRLYGAVQEVGRTLGVGTANDLTAWVTPAVPQSPFLRRLVRVCYYGFYDLTQVQLSFFEAVIRTVPTTLYFPLADERSYAFARRFFERHLAPLAPAPGQIQRAPSHVQAHKQCSGHRQVISVIGPEDELTLVAKEILRLVETDGYRFDDIGVVARTLEPYRADLKRTFDRHRIPFQTTATVPLLREPVAKTVLTLAQLPLLGFHRTQVLDVLAAPCYRRDRLAELGRLTGTAGESSRQTVLEPRPDLWRLAVQALGITRGEEAWERLMSAGNLRVVATMGGDEAQEAPHPTGGIWIEAAQLHLLAKLVAGLIADLAAVPREGSVARLTDAFEAVVARHLTVPGWKTSLPAREPDRAHFVGVAIAEVFRQVRELDQLRETVTWEEWVELLTQAMEQAALPLEPMGHPGVAVLDAMDARGLSFRAMFLLGLNEQLFPRTIREDAFLRDRHRRVLAEVLGYKIDEKLSGYEEERLLFALLEDAARDRLYLCYQRADTEGRPLAVSSYLEPDLRRPDGRPRAPDLVLPRRLSDRLSLPLFSLPLLTPEELGIGLIMQARDPAPLLEATGRSGLLFRHGASLVRELERIGHPGLHDGWTGPLPRYWAELVSRGLSPTALDCYARCPFAYFATRVLKLEPIRARVHDDLPEITLGKLCHDTLRCCYTRLVETGWPEAELDTTSRLALVARVAEEVFQAHAGIHGTGYPLLWQLAKETVIELVHRVVLDDQERYRVSGFHPVAFEVEAEGSLDRLDRKELAGLRVRGRLDRVDHRSLPTGLRVVEYKYRSGREMLKQDRDLVTAAVRGFRLQPPLYTVMEPKTLPVSPGPVEAVDVVFLAPWWDPPVVRSSFPVSTWGQPSGRQVVETLKALIRGIREGVYPIMPGKYCKRCDYAVVCRRSHSPTWWRAYVDGSTRLLRRLRKQQADQSSDKQRSGS